MHAQVSSETPIRAMHETAGGGENAESTLPRWGTRAVDPVLVQRWNGGDTQRELAKAWGVSPNQVAGRLNRLREAGVDVVRRGSPVGLARPRAEPKAAPPPPKRVVSTAQSRAAEAARLDSIALQPVRKESLRVPLVAREQKPPAKPAAPAPQPEQEKASVPPPEPVAASAQPLRSRPSAACCWPIGEPGEKAFRFCDGVSMAGKPYCLMHATRAYVRLRQQGDEAA